MPTSQPAVVKRKRRTVSESKLAQEYASTKDAERIMGMSRRALYAMRAKHPEKFKVMHIPGTRRLFWHIESLRAALQPVAAEMAHGHPNPPL